MNGAYDALVFSDDKSVDYQKYLSLSKKMSEIII